MSTNLVIVESPAKAKTIKKYLGKDFEVLASYGHVRDLVPKEGAVDPSRDFAMKYEVIRERNKDRHVDAIEKAARRSAVLYFATDPDREGEAISWHLEEILRERGALDGKEVHRAKFFEITRSEIQKAIAHPQRISRDLVDAQQARRALDYLVGFNLSPLLWKKIMPGLSAGRVQSVALRLVCDREAEIDAFRSQEYWTVEVDCLKEGQPFRARLAQLDGRKIEADVGKSRFSVKSAAEARVVEERLTSECGGSLLVQSVEAKPRSRSPQAPFRTSTLQQAAVNRLGLSARRTMQLAQKLYEGLDFGEGPVGLITYMRTDSTSLAAEAITQIRETVAKLYGPGGLPKEPRVYRNKQANAQEAHEGIRPTNAEVTPDKLKGHIEEDLWRLYDLIWKRTVASQMTDATFEQVTVTLVPGKDPASGTQLRASGSTLVSPGFLAAYEVEKEEGEEDEAATRLPPLAEGDQPGLAAIRPEQHFTQPPPRYTEASLVRALEERGIGRPSTYASIIETLRARKYVDNEKRNFVPTDTAKIVNNFLVKYFPHYVDYDFTARLEDELDDISRGDKAWVPVMREFWTPFIERVKHVEASVSREEVAMSRVLGVDPKTQRPVSVRIGQYGPFVQLGTKDDEEKPKFAGLKAGQKMNAITLAEALELFTLPRTLGHLPGTQEAVAVGIGRFGPYVKYGSKFVSLKVDDPYTLNFERALIVIEEKRLSDASRTIRDFGVDDIVVLHGRYGPYITDKKRNARVPKGREPASLNLEECRALLAAAPPRGSGRFGARRRAAAKANDAPAAPGPAVDAAAGGAEVPSITVKRPSKPRAQAAAAVAAAPAAKVKTVPRPPPKKAAAKKGSAKAPRRSG
jgi:DNA topoisomerase-1